MKALVSGRCRTLPRNAWVMPPVFRCSSTGTAVSATSTVAGCPPRSSNSLVDKAQGPYVWDQMGRRYIDTALGFGATFLGHTDPVVTEAVRIAMERGSMPAYAHALEEEAAASLAAHTRDLTKVIFLNSGSEAVHLACRTARKMTGRSKIAKAAGGYDGWFDDVAFGNAGSPEALMAGNARPQNGDTLLLRFNDFADADLLFSEYNDIAAIVLEPMMANAGCVVAKPGYLEHVVACQHPPSKAADARDRSTSE